MEVHALMLSDFQRLGAYLAAIRAHHLQEIGGPWDAMGSTIPG